MTEERLLNACISSLNVMNEIIDVFLDNANYPDKNSAYDAIEEILIKKDVIVGV